MSDNPGSELEDQEPAKVTPEVEEEETLEEQLRRTGARGTPVTLNDNCQWLVHSMPCGALAEKVNAAIPKPEEPKEPEESKEGEEPEEPEDRLVPWTEFFDACVAILTLNYPGLTREIANQAVGGLGLLSIDHWPEIIQAYQDFGSPLPDQS